MTVLKKFLIPNKNNINNNQGHLQNWTSSQLKNEGVLKDEIKRGNEGIKVAVLSQIERDRERYRDRYREIDKYKN